MLKKLALSLAVAAALPASALTTGDLAFTAFNADEDGFAMVALANVAANTKVYFSDNEWSGTAFNTGESFLSWLSGAAVVNAGTVIRFSKTANATLLAASVGTLSRETVVLSANWGFSQSADTVYAYLGTSAVAPTTFLSAISSGTFGTAADGTLAHTGLAIGAAAPDPDPGHRPPARTAGGRSAGSRLESSIPCSVAHPANAVELSAWTA